MGVETDRLNMNMLNVLALLAGLYCSCGVEAVKGKGKTLVNTKCFQLITCKGVCSIDPPGDWDNDQWEEDTTGVCDIRRGCKCWVPETGSCTPDDSDDQRLCVWGAGHQGGPPSISTFYQCQNEVCKVDSTNGDCYPWVRKPCDVSICDSFKCVKRYRACAEKNGVCAHEVPEADGWTEDGICHKYNDCKCWVKEE